jgi:hypothetical protein
VNSARFDFVAFVVVPSIRRLDAVLLWLPVVVVAIRRIYDDRFLLLGVARFELRESDKNNLFDDDKKDDDGTRIIVCSLLGLNLLFLEYVNWGRCNRGRGYFSLECLFLWVVEKKYVVFIGFPSLLPNPCLSCLGTMGKVRNGKEIVPISG